MKAFFSYLDDFLSLFFPQLCAACGKNLFKNEEVICTDCMYHLPYTNFHTDHDNRVMRQFYGRIPLNFAGSLLYFKKGTRVQNLMHQLKYNSKPEVGVKLGEIQAHRLKDSTLFQDVNMIIPVPLHPSKLRQRGYNQSESFANGLAETLQIPCRTNILQRNIATATQTRKSRYDRYENMQEVFKLENKDDLTNSHILLVDDVLTTGATLEACAAQLLKIPDIRLSVWTIAFAE